MARATSTAQIAKGVWRIGTSAGERQVYYYLLDAGDGLVLFDAGLKSSAASVIKLLAEIGHPTTDLQTIVISHSHNDHIGGLALLAETSGATVLAHEHAQGWMLDHERQYLERFKQYKNDVSLPPGLHADFFDELGRPWLADRWLDQLPHELPHSRKMMISPTPGHSADSIALWLPEEKLLFCGDAFGGPGIASHLPVYDDIEAYQDTLARIAKLDPNMLLTAHFEMIENENVEPALLQARRLTEQLDEFILAALQKAKGGLTLPFLTQMVCARFGRVFAASAFTTVLAHLRATEQNHLVFQQDNNWCVGKPVQRALPILPVAPSGIA